MAPACVVGWILYGVDDDRRRHIRGSRDVRSFPHPLSVIRTARLLTNIDIAEFPRPTPYFTPHFAAAVNSASDVLGLRCHYIFGGIVLVHRRPLGSLRGGISDDVAPLMRVYVALLLYAHFLYCSSS